MSGGFHAEPPFREVLDVSEAARLLGISEYTARELARKGAIPGRKVGRQWRFSRKALLDWLGGDSEARRRGE